MNIFAAKFILSRVLPTQFLEMDAAARREYLGPLIGTARIVSLACPHSARMTPNAVFRPGSGE